MIAKMTTQWFSQFLQREVLVSRWGWYGTPVLVFPTAGGDAEEIERFLMIDVLGELIEAGRAKVYSCDSVGGRALLQGELPPEQCSRVQNLFDSFVYHELVPAIRKDCASPDIRMLTAGSSIGAFNALASLCRHPDVFTHAICLSGTYDLERFLKGPVTMDFYFSSPIHFLPNLVDCDQLEVLRKRFALIAHGNGRWEEPEESWRIAGVLGGKGIPNRVDEWGPQFDHDWTTWRRMLPHYLAEFLPVVPPPQPA
jgi:esterase/lipase superfamily enzyme